MLTVNKQIQFIQIQTYRNTVKDVIANHGDRYTISPYHVLWPIPQNSINGNVEGVLNQNEGYDGFQNNVQPLTEIPEE